MKITNLKEHWESLREEAFGILSVWARGKTRAADTLDVFWIWMALQRLAPDKKRDELLEGATGILQNISLEAARKALDLVRTERWKAEFNALCAFFDEELGASTTPLEEEEFAQEASRLFRLLDYWRLAVLAMKRRFPRSRKVSRTAKVIDEDLVERVLGRPEVFGDLSEEALEIMGSFQKDLSRADPELAATRDIYAAVSAQGDFEGWDFERMSQKARATFASPLPPIQPAAAARKKSASPMVSFLWEAPGGDAWAYLDFKAGTAEKERRGSLEMVFRGALEIKAIEKVRVFGLEVPPRRGKTIFNQAEFRRALEKALQTGKTSETSFQVKLKGKKRWDKWRMVAPMEEKKG